jgi:hypothetical protein
VAAAGPRLGNLPLARRDVERLRQIVLFQRRLRDLSANPRTQRGLAHRPMFADALTWMEIHGNAPELVEHWKALAPAPGSTLPPDPTLPPDDAPHPRRRRRRRRRRRHFTSTQ